MFVQEVESRLDSEAELRQQLSQQAAAHSDHLVNALHAQRVKLEADFEKRLIVGVQAERERMFDEISALVNRVTAIEAAVDGQLCFAVVIYFIIFNNNNNNNCFRVFLYPGQPE